MAYVLDGLGFEYHTIVTTIMPRGPTTFEELTNLLISEENLLKRIKAEDKITGFAKSYQPRNNNNGQNYGRGRGYNQQNNPFSF